MMNGEEYKNMRAEAFRKNSSSEFSWDGQTESDLYVLFDGEQALVDNYTAGKDFRYLDAVLQKGSQQSHQISARGGTERLLIMHLSVTLVRRVLFLEWTMNGLMLD